MPRRGDRATSPEGYLITNVILDPKTGVKYTKIRALTGKKPLYLVLVSGGFCFILDYFPVELNEEGVARGLKIIGKNKDKDVPKKG